MKRLILRFILPMLFIFLSCENGIDNYTSTEDKETILSMPEITINDAMIVTNSFMNEGGINTRGELPRVENIESFTYNNHTVLYVANFPDNKGHVFISASKNEYPILKYNPKERFDLNNLSQLEIQDFNLLLETLYNQQDCDNTNKQQNILLWEDILNSSSPEIYGDTTVITDIEFIIPDPEDAFPTRGLDDREESSGRNTIFPILDLIPFYWNDNSPYNFDFPYYTHMTSANSSERVRDKVPDLALSASYLYYYQCVKRNFDFPFPLYISNNSQNDQSSPLSRFLYGLSLNLGYQTTGGYHSGKLVNPNISEALFNSTGRNNTGNTIHFTNLSEEAIEEIYQSLANEKPAIAYRGVDNEEAVVLDGYTEVRVKVTKRIYFLGIPIDKKHYYYYRDFFSTKSLSKPYRNGFYQYNKLFPYENAARYIYYNFQIGNEYVELPYSPSIIGNEEISLSLIDRSLVYECRYNYGTIVEYEWDIPQNVTISQKSGKFIHLRFPGLGQYNIKCRVKNGLRNSPWSTKTIKVIDACSSCNNNPCICPVNISMSVTYIGFSGGGAGDISISKQGGDDYHMIEVDGNSHASGFTISLSPGTYGIYGYGTPENDLSRTFTVKKESNNNYTPTVINIEYDDRNWHINIR